MKWRLLDQRNPPSKKTAEDIEANPAFGNMLVRRGDPHRRDA